MTSFYQVIPNFPQYLHSSWEEKELLKEGHLGSYLTIYYLFILHPVCSFPSLFSSQSLSSNSPSFPTPNPLLHVGVQEPCCHKEVPMWMALADH